MSTELNVLPAQQTAAITPAVNNLKSIGVDEFKQGVSASSLSVVRNPKTGKLFIAASNGKTYKCEADIDLTKPVEFLVDGGDLNGACMINTRSTNVLATF